MKLITNILLILTFWVSGFSQTNNCSNQLDTAEVIKIAKKQNAWWERKPLSLRYYSQPKITFDEKNCEWRVKSSKSRTTRFGKCEFSGRDCKEKPGCTVTKGIILVIDANTKTVKNKSKLKHKKHNLQIVDSTPFHIIEREVPVPKIYTLVYVHEVYELINDSTLSENPLNVSVIYQNKDTLLLQYYLSKLSWDDYGVCEPQGITYIPSDYFYNSKIDSTGHFNELGVLRTGNSSKCTESFMKLINKAVLDIEIADAQYWNKGICFRLKVRLIK